MSLHNKILETKLDHKTLHFIPFLPTRKRTKKFKLKGKWGDTDFMIKAPESVNTYDLVTLMFVTKAYLKENWYAGYIGEGEEKREIAGLELDLVQVCKERRILNKKANRETILNSVLRLSHIDLFFKTNNKEVMTKYIYEVRYDSDYKKAKIYANKRFIEFITSKGILLNLSNFIKLEQTQNESKEYAILLYAFLNGTKTKLNFKGKSILKWREKYDEELLFNATKLNETNLPLKRKREELKKAFEILNKELNIPLYVFDKNEKMWIRPDLIQNRNNKIK